jgi:hypothetical protein
MDVPQFSRDFAVCWFELVILPSSFQKVDERDNCLSEGPFDSKTQMEN